MKVISTYLDKTVNKYSRAALSGELKNAQPFFTVWHETGSSSRTPTASPVGTLDYNLTAPKPGTSYTGLIARNGDYYPYISRGYIAYHAGVNSKWLGKVGFEVNVYANGYELDGPNDGTPITDAQKQTVKELALSDWATYGIPLCSLYHPEHTLVAPFDPQGRVYKSDAKGADIAALINPLGLTLFAQPRVSPERFTAVLAKYKSPALPYAPALYEACTTRGFDPAVALAFFVHESSAGTAGIVPEHDTKNWGNVRSPYNTDRAKVITTGRGNFARFTSWVEGLIDFIERLENWYIKDKGLWTVELAVPTYAPSSDGNSPARYIRGVRAMVAEWETAQVQLVAVPSITGEARVPVSVSNYWAASGGVWQASKYALGLFMAVTEEPRATENKIYLFERGALRLKPNGEIEGLHVSEAGDYLLSGR